jgi:hypothetical protein
LRARAAPLPCDANTLGEQEAFLAECGWTGNDDQRDAEALRISTDVLNHAQAITDLWLRVRSTA